MKQKISIVIIGRNEERGIAACITAAQKAAEQIGGAEIICVDSASIDRTVEIAESLGVRVVPLPVEARRCPSAGRFYGSQAATGDFVLFLDADTHIYRDFLPLALEHFRLHPQVGGINGRLDDTDESGELFQNVEERFETVAEVEWLRGPACFYRRSALLAAGSFDPQLAVEEEAELGLRLLKHGWRLKLLPVSMACHTRCYHDQTFTGVLDSFRRDRSTGRRGEILNTIICSFRQGYGLKFCWLRLKTTLLFLGWLASFIACLFLPEYLHPLIIAAMLTLLTFLAVWRKKNSFYQTLLFFPAKMISFLDVLFGIPKLIRKLSLKSLQAAK